VSWDKASCSGGQIIRKSATFAEYRYDGQGRRIAKLIPDGENWDRTDYLYNENWQCLEEQSFVTNDKEQMTDDPSVQWLWDPRYVDSPVLRWRDADNDTNHTLEEALYFTTDANNNVTALVKVVSGAGRVVERYMYDAYGKVTVLNGETGYDGGLGEGQAAEWSADADNKSDWGNEVLYAGYRLDAESGMFQVRNRNYHPTLGRWIERDPEGYVDGMSLYQYCQSNPVGMTDPTGLEGDENAWTEEDFQNWLDWGDGGGPEGASGATGPAGDRGGAEQLTATYPLPRPGSVSGIVIGDLTCDRAVMSPAEASRFKDAIVSRLETLAPCFKYSVGENGQVFLQTGLDQKKFEESYRECKPGADLVWDAATGDKYIYIIRSVPNVGQGGGEFGYPRAATLPRNAILSIPETLPSGEGEAPPSTIQGAAVLLAHELIHALGDTRARAVKGEYTDPQTSKSVDAEQIRACQGEEQIRAMFGMPPRKYADGVLIPKPETPVIRDLQLLKQ